MYVYELPPHLNTWIYPHAAVPFGDATVHPAMAGVRMAVIKSC